MPSRLLYRLAGCRTLCDFEVVIADADAVAHCNADRLGGRLAGRDARRISLFGEMRARACERRQILKTLAKWERCVVAAPCLIKTYATLAAFFVRRTYYASVLA